MWQTPDIPRRLRVASGGYAYHVLNRAVGKARIFGKQRDCEAFDSGDRREAKERLPMRILAWCVPSNHWFVLWPRGDGDLSEFTRWLTVTHTQRIARTASHVRNRPPVPGPFQAVPEERRTITG